MRHGPTKMLGNRSAAAAERIYQRDAARRRAELHKSASHVDNHAQKIQAAHERSNTNRSEAARKANATRKRGG